MKNAFGDDIVESAPTPSATVNAFGDDIVASPRRIQKMNPTDRQAKIQGFKQEIESKSTPIDPVSQWIVKNRVIDGMESVVSDLSHPIRYGIDLPGRLVNRVAGREVIAPLPTVDPEAVKGMLTYHAGGIPEGGRPPSGEAQYLNLDPGPLALFGVGPIGPSIDRSGRLPAKNQPGLSAVESGLGTLGAMALDPDTAVMAAPFAGEVAGQKAAQLAKAYILAQMTKEAGEQAGTAFGQLSDPNLTPSEKGADVGKALTQGGIAALGAVSGEPNLRDARRSIAEERAEAGRTFGSQLQTPEGFNPPGRPKAAKPVVPETQAEPYQSMTDIIRERRMQTIGEIQRLFPSLNLSREQARKMRDDAWPDLKYGIGPNLHTGIDPEGLARDVGIKDLRPAIKIAGKIIYGEQGQTHADVLRANGIDPESVPHTDPRRGFVNVNKPTEFLDRRQSEEVAGKVGTAKAGGLDSLDLPGGEKAADVPADKVETRQINPDVVKYAELTKTFAESKGQEKFAAWQELEALKNKYKGMPPSEMVEAPVKSRETKGTSGKLYSGLPLQDLLDDIELWKDLRGEFSGAHFRVRRDGPNDRFAVRERDAILMKMVKLEQKYGGKTPIQYYRDQRGLDYTSSLYTGHPLALLWDGQKKTGERKFRLYNARTSLSQKQFETLSWPHGMWMDRDGKIFDASPGHYESGSKYLGEKATEYFDDDHLSDVFDRMERKGFIQLRGDSTGLSVLWGKLNQAQKASLERWGIEHEKEVKGYKGETIYKPPTQQTDEGRLYTGIDFSRLLPGRKEEFTHESDVKFVGGTPDYLKKAKVRREAVYEGEIAGPGTYASKRPPGAKASSPWFYHHPEQPGVVMHKTTHKPYVAVSEPKVKSETFTIDGRKATKDEEADIRTFREQEKPSVFKVFGVENIKDKTGEIKRSPLQPKTEVPATQEFTQKDTKKGGKLYSGAFIFDPDFWSSKKSAEEARKRFVAKAADRRPDAGVELMPDKALPVLKFYAAGPGAFLDALYGNKTQRPLDESLRHLKYKWANYSAPAHTAFSEALGNKMIEYASADATVAQFEKLLPKGYKAQALSEWIAQGVRDGVYYRGKAAGVPVVPGKKFVPIEGKGAGNLWVRSDLAPEVEMVLGRKGKFPIAGAQFLLDAATELQVFGGMDFLIHVRNMYASIVRSPGKSGNILIDNLLRLPGAKQVDALSSLAWGIHRVLRDDPTVRNALVEISKIGALRAEESAYGNTWFARKTGINFAKWIQVADRAGRLVRDEMFDNLVKQNLVEDTALNRREFINRMGQYNEKLMSHLQATMKKYFSQFVVAGRRFNRNAFESITLMNEVEAKNASAYWKMKMSNLLSFTATAIAIPVLGNMLFTGRPDGRPGTPAGKIDMGPEYDDEKGRHRTIDLMELDLSRRGARNTGLNRAVEDLRKGEFSSKTIGNMMWDIFNALRNPWFGPFARVGEEIIREKAKTGDSRKAFLAGAKQLNPLTAIFMEDERGEKGLEKIGERVGASFGVGRGTIPSHEEKLEEEQKKPVKQMTLGERLLAERKHKEITPKLTEDQAAEAGKRAIENIKQRGDELKSSMSKADRQWIESRNLRVPGFDNKVTIKGEKVYLTKDETKKLADYTLEEVNKVMTERIRVRYDTYYGQNPRKADDFYSDMMSMAKDRARRRLELEMDPEKQKKKRYSIFDPKR